VFTLGSKTFLGAAGLALLAAIVYSANTTDEVGVLLLVASSAAAIVLALGVLIGAGASDRYSYVGGNDPTPGRDPRGTIVPFVAALATGGLVLGFALGAAGFVVGGVALLAVLVIWFSQAWRDHPSWVPALSKRVSDGVGLPFAMPLALLGVIALIGLAVSRTLLAVNATAAWVVALLVATLIFAGAIVLATRPRLSKQAIAGVLVASVAVIGGLGIYGLARGERPVEHGGEHSEEHAAAFLVGSQAM
jgi:hypothetical protein